MSLGDLVNTVFLAFVTAGLVALWTRLNRLEEKIDTRASVTDLNGLRTELKEDISGLRTEVGEDTSGLRTELKKDISGLRTELKKDISALRTELETDLAEVRREIAGLRSDITQVALMVEPRPPRVSEG